MASSREYLDYILDRLSGLDGVSHRTMMGEYIIYYQGKVVGGIYDDRLLVKPTKSAQEILPDAPYELPYDGAKPMLMVDDPDDSDLLRRLIVSVAEELPEPKRKKK